MMKLSQTDAATVNVAELVYGDQVELDDPAETYHEASKLHPSVLGEEAAGRALLETSAQLQRSTARSTKRYVLGEAIQLPGPALPDVGLTALLRERRSIRQFSGARIDAQALSSLVYAGYGITHTVPASPMTLRTVPSGGALYPLDLYCAVLGVDGVACGVYHYDPFEHALEQVRAGDCREEIRGSMVAPGIVMGASVVLLIAAMFRRNRFKYGLRGYRFALIEAGHLAQNVLLASQSLQLGGVPLGGYYDRGIDELLGMDGVNESVVYTLAIGVPA